MARSATLLMVVDWHVLRLASSRVVPGPCSLAALRISAGRGVQLIASVLLFVDVLQVDVLGLMPCAVSGSISLVLQGRQAVAQVLQGLGVVLSAIIILDELPSIRPASASLVEGPLVLLRQKIVLVVLIAIIVALSAPLLLLGSPPGLGQLGREGVVLIRRDLLVLLWLLPAVAYAFLSREFKQWPEGEDHNDQVG